VSDFEGVYIDGLITFSLRDEPSGGASKEPRDFTDGSDAISIPVIDPVYRIKILESANRQPIYISPNDTVQQAITIMMARDFSQLPVMTNERDVKGVVTWASIGSRLALGAKFTEVRECMENAHIVSSEISLFDAITIIVTEQYVLVQDAHSRRISGIVTTSDLSAKLASSRPACGYSTAPRH
jgi:predicted transcriptional regulator